MGPVSKSSINRRYERCYSLTIGKDSTFFICFDSTYGKNNLRIDLVPTQLKYGQLKKFFNWLYNTGSFVADKNRLTCCDIGFTMHGLYYPFLNMLNQRYRTFDCIPEASDLDENDEIAETIYVPKPSKTRWLPDAVTETDSERQTHAKFYSPTARALRELDMGDGQSLIRATMTCSRAESSFIPKGTHYYNLKFGDIEKVPCSLKEIKLVSPEIFLEVSLQQAMMLMRYKANDLLQSASKKHSPLLELIKKHSVTINEAVLTQQIGVLAKKFEPVFTP